MSVSSRLLFISEDPRLFFKAPMAEIYPLQVLLTSLSGWLNGQQGDVLAYLIEENRVLKEQLNGRCLRPTDEQRWRLASKGKRIGRRLLMEVARIVTSDTILRWHRRLIAAKWTYKTKRKGRPGVMKKIQELVVRFENPSWGYCRIHGALQNLGHRVAPSTIAKILKEHGIKSAPDRPTSWLVFLRAHWREIAGTDFFTTEVWALMGLRAYYVLFFIELNTCRAHLAGLTTNPTNWFMGLAAERSLDFLSRSRFVIHDRDAKFSFRFRLSWRAPGSRRSGRLSRHPTRTRSDSCGRSRRSAWTG